jgi:hypothetical protein
MTTNDLMRFLSATALKVAVERTRNWREEMRWSWYKTLHTITTNDH